MTTNTLRWWSAGSVFAMLVGAWLLVVGVRPELGFDRLIGVTFPTDATYAGPPTGVARLATAVSGALTLFVGMIAWTLRPAFRQPAVARMLVPGFTFSLCTWFVLDGAASILVGAPLNALWNILLLLALLPPLRRADNRITE